MSNGVGTDEKSLNRNSIKKFILRVDILTNTNFNIGKAAEEMSKYFDRTEKRQLSQFTLHFTKSDSETSKKEVFDFVLISEAKSISLTFSEVQNAFWIESSQYINNSTYKGIMDDIVKELTLLNKETEAKIIGLRYINEFACEKINNVNRIYGKRLSTIIKAMMLDKNQSRVIGVEEFNNADGYKLRLQYGIPNKFYPSVITVYDLLLDIDSYIESTCNINEWNDIITKLNHAAYEQFVRAINLSYLEVLK